ncbi:signal peptidase I [Enterococcus quebecensis]|uniref:Signal peptidase I n=1 Tax=Enterococcus quebecensis TaxID=903983 RepID=A0A1E5GS17_9ENTE|nr:signal peptidase I [Enterococcus quebecensis]OEG15513.1 signal peptidase I [Enterococcus quebecensis]OJG73984.1 signal peptidase I [Enterococcus quebecensis]
MNTKKQRLSKGNNKQVTEVKKKKQNGTSVKKVKHKKNKQGVKKYRPQKQKAIRQKKKYKKTSRKKRKQRVLIKEILVTSVISILVLSILFILNVQLPNVEGYSMTPTINDQDWLFVSKRSEIRRFSLISFDSPDKDGSMIRRVIGLPGDELYYQNGSLFINGSEIPERFLSTSLSEVSEDPQTVDFTLEEVTKVAYVPEDSYFVLGDNRLYATDSRYFGFIKKKEITGVVKARIFPIHAMRQF